MGRTSPLRVDRSRTIPSIVATLTPLPWRALLVWAVVGTALGVGLTVWDLDRTSASLGGLVVARPDQESARVIGAELGADAVRAGGGHDGAFFYVIARDPWHPNAVAADLDAPRYRLQRIVFPLLGWIGHPTGGGDGLVGSLFVVGVVGLLLGGAAMGALSVTLRGPPWIGVLFPVMIGSFVSLRITVADPLSVAFALLAIVLLLRGHLPWAVVAGIAAVLTKETAIVILLGIALWKRDRAAVLFVAIPAGCMVAWAAVVRLVVSRVGELIPAFDLPFIGIRRSIDFWLTYDEPLGWLSVIVALGLAALALVRRGWRHPLAFALLGQLLLLVFVTASVLAPERNGSRTVLPLTILAIVMLGTPRAEGAVERSPG